MAAAAEGSEAGLNKVEVPELPFPEVTADPTVPFDIDEEGYKVMLWLSREEWSLVYSLVNAWQMEGTLNLELPLPVLFQAVVTRLEHDFGYECEGLRATVDGDLYPRDEHPVEVANIQWVLMYQQDKPPDYLARVKEAIEYAERDGRLIRLRPILLALADKIENDLEYVRALEPETGFKQWVAEQMQTVGTVH